MADPRIVQAMMERTGVSPVLSDPRQFPTPTPDQEALEDPLISPETYGAGSLAKESVAGALAGMKGLGALAGMTVYHGSPHRFPPTKNNPLGEFSESQIGTGTGSHTFGRGHYLAKNREVAQGYADGLSRDKGILYAVDLPDEQIGKMLNYSAPLSRQSGEVQALLQQAHQIRAKQTGGAFGKLDMNQHVRDAIETIGEQRLRQAGIPGIKYTDHVNRPNFVVFDETIPKIIGRHE